MRKPVPGWKYTPLALTTLALFLMTCKLETGDQPLGPPVTGGGSDKQASLSVSATETILRSNGTDSSIITAQLLDSYNNALAGETIQFRHGRNGGRFPAQTSVLTNEDGEASIKMTSLKTANGDDTVYAISPAYRDTASIIITFVGTSMRLSVSPESQKINDTVIISAQLTDNEYKPITSGTVTFTTATGVFRGGIDTFSTALDKNGNAEVYATSANVGNMWVHVNAINNSDSIMVFFDSVATEPPKSSAGTRNFRVYSSRSQLKADNSDTATIWAEFVDENHNPAVGDTIKFTCNIGTIYPAMAIVDSTGRARATLRSEATNGTCIVKATSVRNTSEIATTQVSFSGVVIRIESDVTDLKINETATITARVSNASGNTKAEDTVFFSTTGGEFPSYSPPYQTDPAGRSTIKVTSRTAGEIKVYAASANTRDSITILFTNNALDLSATKSTLVVGGADSSRISATYVDGSGSPVGNAVVTFSTNAGTIVTPKVTTDNAGKASTILRSASFAGTATIVATTSAGNALVKVNFISSVPKNIKLMVSPDNVGVNGGISSLTATVTDENENTVTGVNVNFRVLKGPGGGEYIDKPVAATQNGITHAQFFAGSVPSQYRGCLISASVGDIADTTKLTISGEPYAISVSRPQSDTVVVPKAGQLDESTFDYFVGAVVVDINGNPVADGTRVNFSSVVSGLAVHQKILVRWAGLGSAGEKKPVYGYRTWDIPFEDINNNFRMDENDLKLDYNDAVASRGDDVNGDGKCDFDPTVHDLWFDFNGNGKVDAGSVRTPVIVMRPQLSYRVDTLCKDTIIEVDVRTGFNDTLWADSLITICHTAVGGAVTCKDTVIEVARWSQPSGDTLWKDTAVTLCRQVIRADTVGYDPDTVGFSTEYPGAEPFIIVDGVRIWADLYPNGVWDTTELVRDVNGDGIYDVPASGDRRWWEHETLPFWQGQRFDFDKNDFGVAVTTSTPTKNGVAYAKLTYPRQLARRLFVTVNAESNGVRDRDGERFILPVIVGQ